MQLVFLNMLLGSLRQARVCVCVCVMWALPSPGCGEPGGVCVCCCREPSPPEQSCPPQQTLPHQHPLLERDRWRQREMER